MIFVESTAIFSVSLLIFVSACIEGSRSISKVGCFCLIESATVKIMFGLLDRAFGINYHIVMLFLLVAPLKLKLHVLAQHSCWHADKLQQTYFLTIELTPSIFYSHSGLSLFDYKPYLFLGSILIFHDDEISLYLQSKKSMLTTF